MIFGLAETEKKIIALHRNGKGAIVDSGVM